MGQADAIVCSPPYADSVNGGHHGIDPTKGVHAALRPQSSRHNREQLQSYTTYGTAEGQVGALKSGPCPGGEADVGDVKTLTWAGCYGTQWGPLLCPAAMSHPAKFSYNLLTRLYDHGFERGWWRKGDLVADCFGGVGCGGVVAAYRGLRWVGCELEPRFVALAEESFALHRGKWLAAGDSPPMIVQGDSREFAKLVGGVTKLLALWDVYEAGGGAERLGDFGAWVRSVLADVDAGAGAALVAGAAACVTSGLAVTTSDNRILTKEVGADEITSTPGEPFELREVHESLGGQGGRDPAPLLHPRMVPAEVGGLFQGSLADASEGHEEARHEAEGACAERGGALPLEGWPAQQGLPQDGNEGPLPAVRGDRDAGHSPQERRPLRQPPGEPGSPLQQLPHERDEAEVVGREEGGAAHAQEQRPRRLAARTEVSAIITSPPYAASVHGRNGIDLAKCDRPGAHTQAGAQGYGDTPGNVGGLAAGDADSVVTSPPFADSLATNVHHLGFPAITGNCHRKAGQTSPAEVRQEYGAAPGQVGALRQETYWDAVRYIYGQCLLALRPGGVACVVIKDFVRAKKRVPLCDQTWRLLLSLGFQPVERIRCLLSEETREPSLFGGVEVKKRSRQSFFRRLATKKGAPDIPFEEILVVRRPGGASDG